MKIALAFFGLPRSTAQTWPSIESHLIGPLSRCGELRVFYHFMRQSHVLNTPSGEAHALDTSNYEPFQRFTGRTDRPLDCLDVGTFRELSRHGDYWRDGFQSLRNLMLQLHSLDAVAHLIAPWQPDVVMYARPDLLYHEPVLRDDVLHAAADPLALIVPGWQWWWGGYNDRFAICGRTAAGAYGHRRVFALPYCRAGAGPMHSERLLRLAAAHQQLHVKPMAMRATRIRASGEAFAEDFRWMARTYRDGP